MVKKSIYEKVLYKEFRIYQNDYWFGDYQELYSNIKAQLNRICIRLFKSE